jgi:putative SOS response-associated peptidase YedK
MCGRFASLLPPEALARLFATTNPLPNVAATWNLAPSQDAPVVRRHPESSERHLDLLRWGLLPHYTKDPGSARRPINARAETVATSGMFRSAFAARRCLVPAAVFYEWRKADRAPHAIGRADGETMALAGLWESFRWPDGRVERTFVIITTAANATLAALHDRMPVVLEAADWALWLGEAAGDPATLLRPAGESVLRVWPVSRQVNSPRSNGPDLLRPLASFSASCDRGQG